MHEIEAILNQIDEHPVDRQYGNEIRGVIILAATLEKQADRLMRRLEAIEGKLDKINATIATLAVHMGGG